jgi:hypothetical protein
MDEAWNGKVSKQEFLNIRGRIIRGSEAGGTADEAMADWLPEMSLRNENTCRSKTIPANAG